ncbi:ethanolamine ammonia-lyase light chain EutC, partial [Hymenobacter coccineus]|uniref:ethanolamine ammonia-lyase light chain EutC n=1 Tax=Hymenobacter coccineus TaxID=1908235 RepID=UPI000ADA9160
LVLIGERPGAERARQPGGLLHPRARPGLTDAARNCVSNIRPAGLGYAAAADTLGFLLRESLRLGLSGVGLKDESGQLLGS